MNMPSLNLGNQYSSDENNSPYVTLGPDDFKTDDEFLNEAAPETKQSEPFTVLTQDDNIGEISDDKIETREDVQEVFFSDEDEVIEEKDNVDENNVSSNIYIMDGEEESVDEYIDRRKSKEDPKEVIRIPEEETEIEGLPYSRENKGRPVKKVDIKEALFGTERAAQALGTTAQTIRDYCDNYDFYLNIPRTPKGARRFTVEDIEKLRYIMKTKEEKQFTVKEMQGYLRDPEHFTLERNVLDKGTMQLFVEELMEKMSQQMTIQMEMMMKQNLEFSNKLIEAKDEKTATLMEKMNQRLSQQEKDFEKLLNEIKESSKATQDKEKEHAEQIDNLMSMIKEKDRAIESLKEEANNKDLQILELQNTNKPKKFFGLFG